MKAAVVLVAAASAAVASAQPHGHAHFHHHAKRATTVTVNDPVHTAYDFVLNGETLSRDQVCSGINDGSLKFSGNVPAGICGAPAPISVASPSASSPSAGGAFFEKPATTSTTPPPPPPTTTSSSKAAAAPSPAPAAKSPSVASVASDVVSDITGFLQFTSANAKSSYPDFQSGVHPCSGGPPTMYGAVHLSWMGGGWASTQIVSGNSLQGTSNDCEEGNLCGYACVPGMQMAQWPTNQPPGGESLGGLLCSGGMLHATNSNPQLCSTGSGEVDVQNKGNKGVSICRTIYPGTESETVPLWVPAGQTEPLTTPIEADYYLHLGAKTSAEYYLNQPGVTPDKACTWNGNGDGQSGNWAPIVLGAGNDGGKNWLSIQENTPTSHAAFAGTVEIVGAGCNGDCKYSNGQFCYGGSCQPVTQDGAGCTTACTGQATFVISF